MFAGFTFDNIMYRQIDGVSMKCPLGPALANIFIGFHEKKLLASPNKLVVYFHFVDSMFCLFNNVSEEDLFFTSLNDIHPALRFTRDKKLISRCPF